MAAHESLVRDDHVQVGSDRSFGLIVGGILLFIAAYQGYRGSTLYLWFGVPGAFLLLAGLVLPAVLHPLNLAWTRLGILLGRIVTPIVMFLVFVTTVVPIALLLRIFGKQPLSLKRNPPDKSYWIERIPPGPSPESLKDQF